MYRPKQIFCKLVSQNELKCLTKQTSLFHKTNSVNSRLGHLLRYGNDGYGVLSWGIQNEYK